MTKLSFVTESSARADYIRPCLPLPYHIRNFLNQSVCNRYIVHTRLTKAQLKAVEGKYPFEFQKGRPAYIQITANNLNGIVLKQLWDNQEISFVPESDMEFFCEDFPFPLKFSKDANGKVVQVLAFNRDLWNRVQP